MIIPQRAAFCAALGALLAAAQTPPAAQRAALDWLDAQAPRFGGISQQIWGFAELGFNERQSAALLRSEFTKAGFNITDNIGGMPTAFTAAWGSGKPVIAILGEYDALPGLSQEATATRKPVVAGGSGHGCGHNLLGTAAAMAAIAVKEQMAQRKRPGTVRFYGTPAEEGGGGKIYMLRAGAFKDVDAVLAWHPLDQNAADDNSWLANISSRIRFYGTAAHAAAAPDAGRSALDALELTTHAVNMLREHVPQETRIHYIVAKGGAAANIVPDFAELSLIARHPDLTTLEGIWQRIARCAEAGALATGTRAEIEITSSYANMLTNAPLRDLLRAALNRAGGVHYTPEEERLAADLRRSLTAPGPAALGSQANIAPDYSRLFSASSDVGDVSWNVPTGHFYTATFVPGTPPHTWQATASAGSSIGRKGMLVAAKTLTLATLDLLGSPELVRQARAAFDARRAGREYRSLLPAAARPGAMH